MYTVVGPNLKSGKESKVVSGENTRSEITFDPSSPWTPEVQKILPRDDKDEETVAGDVGRVEYPAPKTGKR